MTFGTLAYFVFHGMTHMRATVTRPDQMAGAVVMGHDGWAGRVPPVHGALFCAIAAAVSMFRRGKRTGLVTGVASSNAAAVLEETSQLRGIELFVRSGEGKPGARSGIRLASRVGTTTGESDA